MFSLFLHVSCVGLTHYFFFSMVKQSSLWSLPEPRSPFPALAFSAPNFSDFLRLRSPNSHSGHTQKYSSRIHVPRISGKFRAYPSLLPPCPMLYLIIIPTKKANTKKVDDFPKVKGQNNTRMKRKKSWL